jgi:hypothetical protein
MDNDEAVLGALYRITELLEAMEKRQSEFQSKLLKLVESLDGSIVSAQMDLQDVTRHLEQIDNNTAAAVPPAIEGD